MATTQYPGPQFCTTDDVQQIAGQANLQGYSDLNNTGSVELTDVNYWINYASSIVCDVFLYEGGANSPPSFFGASVFRIAVITAKMALKEIYFARGVMRDEATDTKMAKMGDEAYKDLLSCRQELRPNVVRRWAAPTGAVGYRVNGISGG